MPADLLYYSFSYRVDNSEILILTQDDHCQPIFEFFSLDLQFLT
jgi:hypothetical protein